MSYREDTDFTPVIVVDLDGTVFDCGHRQQHAQAGDWDKFHSLAVEDKPFEDTRQIIKMLSDKFIIVACTGRNERYRNITTAALANFEIPVDTILMRPDDDFTSDHILKPAMLEGYFLGNKTLMMERVLVILEDRDKVVEAWRNLGFNCWQVRMGTF